MDNFIAIESVLEYLFIINMQVPNNCYIVFVSLNFLRESF